MVAEAKSIWMDGEQVAWSQANVHVLTHTLHYGFGIFEGIRAYRQRPGEGGIFRLNEHVQRLVDTARMTGLALPWSGQAIRAAILETLQHNGLDEAYIRPLIYLGGGPMDVVSQKNPVHLSIATWPWGAYLGEEGLQRGIRCCTSTFTRLTGQGHLPKGKIVGHYVNSILAKDEAQRLGFDEALLCDAQGHVLEGSSENLFIAREGRLLTAPFESDILGGITRDAIIEVARDLGIRVEERLFGRDVMYLADEVLLTGTAAEVTPVREIDGRRVGDGRPGPITRQLQVAFRELIRGRSPAYRRWLTPYSLPPAEVLARDAA